MPQGKICLLYTSDFWIKIRRMLQAVAQHSTKEEILSQNFIEEFPRYSGMAVSYTHLDVYKRQVQVMLFYSAIMVYSVMKQRASA